MAISYIEGGDFRNYKIITATFLSNALLFLDRRLQNFANPSFTLFFVPISAPPFPISLFPFSIQSRFLLSNLESSSDCFDSLFSLSIGTSFNTWLSVFSILGLGFSDLPDPRQICDLSFLGVNLSIFFPVLDILLVLYSHFVIFLVSLFLSNSDLWFLNLQGRLIYRSARSLLVYLNLCAYACLLFVISADSA